MDKTRKKKLVYTFVTKFRGEDQLQDIDDTKTYFYQIATYAEPQYGKYNIREFCLNGRNEILDVQVYWVAKKEYKRFKASKKCNEYKAYDVYNLANINYPTAYDIHTCRSDLLNHDDDYTGFAAF